MPSCFLSKRSGYPKYFGCLIGIDCSHISHAILDVFSNEPLPKESPLWRHSQVTITPHVAALSKVPM